MFTDEGDDTGDRLINFDDPLIQRAGFRFVIRIRCGCVIIGDGAGLCDQLRITGSHALQDGENGILQLLQAGRSDALVFALIISLGGAIPILSTIIEGHQAATGGAVNEAGKRVDLPSLIDGRSGCGLLLKGTDTRPFCLGEDRRHAAWNADCLRRGDTVARIRAEAANVGAGVDFILQ